MKKRNSLISFVDLLLTLILVLFTVIFAFLSFGDSSKVDFSQKESLSVTLRVKEIPRKHDGLIRVNDNIYFSDDSDVLGKIKIVSYSNSSVEYIDKVTNASSIYKSPDKLDVLISVECEASVDETNFVVADKSIAVGDVLDLITPEYSFGATVIKIEKNEGWQK